MRTPQFVDQQQRRLPSLRTAQPIEPVSLTTTIATVIAAKADADFLVSHLWVANVTGLAATYTLHFVPSGGTASTANMVAFQTSLGANASAIVDVAINHRLPEGASIQALCSTANAINIGGWGYDQRGD